MYVSHQLLTAHQDEMLRRAASRRLVLQRRATARAAARRNAGSQRMPRALRLGRLVGQA